MVGRWRTASAPLAAAASATARLLAAAFRSSPAATAAGISTAATAAAAVLMPRAGAVATAAVPRASTATRPWRCGTSFGFAASVAGAAATAAPAVRGFASTSHVRQPPRLWITVRQLGPAAAAAAGGGAVAVVAVGSRVGSTPFASHVRSVWVDNSGYQHFQGRGRPWPFNDRRMLYIVAAVAVGTTAYYFYCMETVPYTGRRHSIMLVSSANEQWMGRMVFEEQKAIARAEGRLLPAAHPDSLRVQRLGRAIAAVAADGAGGGQYQHMRNLDWEFVVIDNPMPNAFVVPGGKVVVFTGLLRLLGNSDDELAAVIAHEVGHVLARHQAERMSTLNAWTLINMVLRLTFGFGLPNVAMYMGIFLPYSRLAEHEADVIGLRLMARACFDPEGAPVMLEKLNRVEKKMAQRGSLAAAIPAFLRTHPLTEDRVKLVEKDLPEAYRLYHASGCGVRRSALGRAAGVLNGWLDINGNGADGGGGSDAWIEAEGPSIFRFGDREPGWGWRRDLGATGMVAAQWWYRSVQS